MALRILHFSLRNGRSFNFPVIFFEAVCSGVFANERELCDWKVLSQKLHHSVWNMAEHFALGT